MNKRINVILPESTLAVLDKVVAKGSRSRFVDMAIQQFVQTQSRRNLREQLKAEGLANAERDLLMSAEWFPLEEEAWQAAPRTQRKKK